MEFYKAMKSANNWNLASAIALGISASLFAIEAGWVSNNLFFDIPSLSYIYFIVVAAVCKLEVANIHRVTIINQIREKT